MGDFLDDDGNDIFSAKMTEETVSSSSNETVTREPAINTHYRSMFGSNNQILVSMDRLTIPFMSKYLEFIYSACARFKNSHRINSSFLRATVDQVDSLLGNINAKADFYHAENNLARLHEQRSFIELIFHHLHELSQQGEFRCLVELTIYLNSLVDFLNYGIALETSKYISLAQDLGIEADNNIIDFGLYTTITPVLSRMTGTVDGISHEKYTGLDVWRRRGVKGLEMLIIIGLHILVDEETQNHDGIFVAS